MLKNQISIERLRTMETTIVREVTVNYRSSVAMSETLSGPAEVAAIFRQILPDNSREHLMALYLNGAHQPIAYSIVSTGTATSSAAHPRELFQPALLVGAVALLIGHNHPSGSLEPSKEDRTVTRRIKEVSELIGIKLLDHVIVTDEGYMSFSDSGEL
jgi:DNA repair protein RadC